MADPCDKPIKWSKTYQVYVEKHNLYDTFQELMKQIILNKPKDPLIFIRDQLPRIPKRLYNPQAFVVGSDESYGKRLAEIAGTKFLTLEEIILESGKEQLDVFTNGDNGDERARKILANVVHKRLMAQDCEAHGYVLYGFPQSKAQALLAQQAGALPRQVFVFLPETGNEEEESVMKDIASAYHYEICKVIPFEKQMKAKKGDLESELHGMLMTGKASGAPFVPRISLMGPPASGKSEVAEYLADKFSVVNVDWVELVRGAERWEDETAAEAKSYLTDLKPMSEESVKAILNRRLSQVDCDKKGWILHGFPETKRQAELLAEMFLEPNRIFLFSCTQEKSSERMAKKRKAVMKRHLTPEKPPHIHERGNLLVFPFGEKSVLKRFGNFNKNVDGILEFYGSKVIFVDAAKKLDVVKTFVENSVMRPPIQRKK